MKYSLLLTILLLQIGLFGQNVWQEVSPHRNNVPKKQRITHPDHFKTISLDVEAFKVAIRELPSRSEIANSRRLVSMEFPLPNGKMGKFKMMDAELMHPDLAAKFPQLKAFIGKGIDDPTADIRITYSPYHGFNGMIQSGNHSTVYIDPLTKDHQDYMVYYRKDVQKQDEGFICSTPGADVHNQEITEDFTRAEGPYGDCNLRRYRLAQSCTGEYAQYHIGQAGGTTGTTAGDKAIVQSAMNVTMVRVNGVYEKDLGITMQFIANNDDVIYLNGATDPWNGEWNTQTAITLDAVIGVNNYDIGHNFNTTGGGNAGCLTCVCSSVSQSGTHKGRGYTGRAAPIGDPFDIDYVAHEMGHQFGGYHTMNNCSRSGNGSSEIEPGSASTIMGYAGICPVNVQSNSDDYFHYVNIRDIVDAINNGSQNSCAELIVSGNSGPSADAGLNYTIPASTPFKLTGIGSDSDDTALTYCWEQNDPENAGSNAAPQANWTVGPMFRSFKPVAEPYRYFPRLTDVINNVSPTWEVLPSVSRNMEFAFTVRDNNINSGCTSLDLMSVTTVASAGPFLVNVPNTNVTWGAGTAENVTWDVAGTNGGSVNCANVDILMSTDGGQTYPITLASNVTNDGSQSITVPNNAGTTNRVMVVCSDNIFYDISNTDFTIVITAPQANLAATSTTILEETTCTTRDITFDVVLNAQPSGTTSVPLATSGTATLGDDYTMSPSSVSFTTGNWNVPKTVTLTIEEDAVVEADETIIIDITAVNGSDAVEGGSGQLTFTLVNDDNDPMVAGGSVSSQLINEDFESGFPTTWTRTGSAQVFNTGTAATLSSNNWTIAATNSSQILASNDDDCNCNMSNEILKSPIITVNSNMTAIDVDMQVFFEQGTYNGTTESAILQLSQDGGSNFSTVYTFAGVAGSWQAPNVDLTSELPASGTESWQLQWVYNDGADWLYGFAIDDIIVNETSNTMVSVQSAINTANGFAEHDLGPGDIVHFYDQVTGEIMCTIDNSASSHDYGCTKVEVDRAGTASVGFVNTLTNSFLHSKTFKVTPFNNTSSDAGGYTITLYYSDAEVIGWEGMTGEARTATFIHKADGNNQILDVSATNPGNIPISSQAATYGTFNGDHTYSATFNNGFSGFGVGIDVSPLPVELLEFTGEHLSGKGNQLNWTTVSEENTSHFEVERSIDSREFEMIGSKIDAAGNSTEKLDYAYLDENPKSGINYYRLKMIDLDGSYEYSQIININNNDLLDITFAPNPTKGEVIISFNQNINDNIQIELFNLSGKLIKERSLRLNNENQILFNMDELAKGTYFVRITANNNSYGEKMIKL